MLPGLIDPHVHLRDPGDKAVETIPTGTRAAVLGGLAAVFDMPNTAPSIIDAERLAWKQDYVERESWCDIGLYVGGTKQNIPQLATLELGRGVCGIKIFAGSSHRRPDGGGRRAPGTGDALAAAAASPTTPRTNTGCRTASRCSSRAIRIAATWNGATRRCAFLGTRRLMALARATGRPAHILHVSTAEELDYLKDFRDVATCEVLVNHLTQVAPDCYDQLKGFGVMNPPIRGPRHLEAAWRAINDGTVDTIGSDHAPHSRDKKLLPWPDCPAGLTGVQTIVPMMLNHVNAGRLSLTRMVDLMCAGPARVYGVVGKGRLAAGYDADFTLVDMKRRRRIEESLDRLALRLDAVRRHGHHRLAGRRDRARPGGDARRRGVRGAGRPAGAVSGIADLDPRVVVAGTLGQVGPDVGGDQC